MNVPGARKRKPAINRDIDASKLFERELVALIPALLAFARKLCRGNGIAEDMTQETLAKAWKSRATFAPGTNLRAWLFVILRNTIFSRTRRSWREMEWDQDTEAEIAAPPLEQEWSAELSDVARALNGLPDSQREAVILVGFAGCSYRDAADISGEPIGTMKSRYARGRARMFGLLEGDKPLPPRRRGNTLSGTDDIQLQLSALMQPRSTGTAIHA